MLEKYKVVKEKNEDVLYLYLSMNYEFAKDYLNKKYNKIEVWFIIFVVLKYLLF